MERSTDLYSCEETHSDDISPDLASELADFISLQERKHPEHPALSNMQSGQPWGFLNLIATRERWRNDQGQISLLRHRGSIVGISCVEHGQLHERISIGGVRCWLDSEHRTSNLMSRYLLESNLRWSNSNGKLGMLLTFNDYNKWLYDAARRISGGKAGGIGNVWSGWWKDTIPLLRPINVRNVDQWCLCKPIIPGPELAKAISEIENESVPTF